MKKQTTFQLTLIAAALAGMQAPAQAEEISDDVRALIKPDSEVSVGIGQQWHDRRQLGKYDGMAESGTYYRLDADIRRRDDVTGVGTEFSVRNLGLDTLEAGIRIEQQGNWGGALAYDRLVSNNPNTFFTGIQGIGTSTLTYGTIGTTNATAKSGLFPATREVHLGTARDNLSFTAYKYLAEGLALNVSLKQEDKRGTRHWGRGVNPEFAVEPIDSTTTQIEAALNFAGERYQLSGGYAFSRYENKLSFVDTIGGSQLNSGTTTDAEGHTFLSLPLDNVAHQVFANGGYNFTDKTRVTVKASYSVATQKDPLSPITNAITGSGAAGTSGVIPFSPGVPNSLDGKVETKLIELGLTTKPIDKLTVVANARYQSRADKTPLQEFANFWQFRCTGSGTTTQYAGGPAAPTDATCTALGLGTLSAPAGTYTGPTQTVVDNNPRDFKNLAGKLEATYRLPMGYSVTGGVNLDRRERTYETDPTTGEYEGVVKMRNKTDEVAWNLQVRRAMSESMNGSVALQHANRTGSTWHPAEGVAAADHPINFLNPAPFADRKRDKVRAAIDWAPASNVQMQLVGEFARDKYETGRAGVKDGRTRLWAFDTTIAINDNWQVNGWVSQDFTKHNQTNYTFDGRQTSAPNWACSTVPGMTDSTGAPVTCLVDLIWDAGLEDSGTAVGVALRGSLTPSLKVGAEGQWSHTQSRYPIVSNVPNLTSTTGNAQNVLPDITTDTIRLALFGQYAVQKNGDLRLDLVYTYWKTDDWTTMMYNTAGNALVPFTYMDGTRVVATQSQNATFAGVKYIYRFQ